MKHYCPVCQQTHVLWTQYRNEHTLVCRYCGYRKRDHRLAQGQPRNLNLVGGSAFFSSEQRENF